MSQIKSVGSVIMLGGMQVGGVGSLDGTEAEAPPVRPLNDDWRRWVAENVLLNNSPQLIEATLVKSGFDQTTAAREVALARSHPYVAAARQVAGRPGAGGISPARLTKREWVLEMYRRSAKQDPGTATVPVVHKPSREQFLHEFYSINRPVLIQGAMEDWPAMKLWTMDYLKEKAGEKTVEVQMGRNSDANYEINSTAHKKQMSFGQYVDLAVSSGRTNDFYITANNSGLNRDSLAGLWDDIVLFPDYLRTDNPDNRGFFWFGPAGTVTPLHHDLTNNFMAQVVGRKLVKLIAPYDLPYVYNFRHCFSRVDPANPDLEKYPLFRNARVIDVILNPGELLFLPIGWWHAVYGLDISITMTFTGFVFDNDFSSFYSTYNDIDV
jgi:hypothetical protein